MNDYTRIVLQINNASVGYGKKAVLSGVDFSVGRGDMIGIIGPNGAGKSTLIKTLRGFLPVQAGSVKLFGVPVDEITPRDFACKVAYLQQQEHILPGYTVQNVVMAGRYPHLKWWQHENAEDYRIARACMAYTGVLGLAERDMLALSGGQRQRAFLARVLAQQTELLFLDEPATGLDLFYQEEVLHFCRSLCERGRTAILVAHELALAARFCTKLILLGKGHMMAIGPPKDVLTEKNLSAVYDVPITVHCDEKTGHLDVYSSVAGCGETDALLDIIIGRKGASVYE